MFGIIFTICQGKIIDRFNTLAGNIFLCVFLLIGTVMTGKAWSRGELPGGMLLLLQSRNKNLLACCRFSCELSEKWQ